MIAAKATVESARINLAYTKVTAPISGRIGKSTVTEGALVTNGQTTELATVQQLDPIYVDVTQSSNDFMRLKQSVEQGNLHKENATSNVELVMENGQTYPLKGTLQFSDVTVDESTGSITLRAIFPNPQLSNGLVVLLLTDVFRTHERNVTFYRQMRDGGGGFTFR